MSLQIVFWPCHGRVSTDVMICRETPPETFHFLASSSNPPVATDFKPAVKVLSRKPAPQMIAKHDPVTGVSKMTIQGDDDDEAEPKVQLTPQEIRAKQQREREAKQRQYYEARAKIFGNPSSDPNSSTSTPRNTTPSPGPEGRNQRARGRGRPSNRANGGRNHDGREDTRRPAAQTASRELYDPNYSPKPGSTLGMRGNHANASQCGLTPREEDQVIREPRGPDGSGRGGFGFAKRGAQVG